LGKIIKWVAKWKNNSPRKHVRKLGPPKGRGWDKNPCDGGKRGRNMPKQKIETTAQGKVSHQRGKKGQAPAPGGGGAFRSPPVVFKMLGSKFGHTKTGRYGPEDRKKKRGQDFPPAQHYLTNQSKEICLPQRARTCRGGPSRGNEDVLNAPSGKKTKTSFLKTEQCH